VAFVSTDRWEKTDRYFEGAPEIVIEVLSPSNTAAEMMDKEQLCLENGAKEFWALIRLAGKSGFPPLTEER